MGGFFLIFVKWIERRAVLESNLVLSVSDKETEDFERDFGLNGNATTGFNWFPIFTQRVFNMSAGIHTFRLEGMKYGGSDAGATVYIYDPVLTAIFYPTSYGTVNTYVSSGEAGEFDNVTVERVPNRGEVGDGQAVYKVDLRELEIKARDARLRAQEAYIEQLEAERELNRARRDIES